MSCLETLQFAEKKTIEEIGCYSSFHFVKSQIKTINK